MRNPANCGYPLQSTDNTRYIAEFKGLEIVLDNNRRIFYDLCAVT